MNAHGYAAILAAIRLPDTQGVDDDVARGLVTAIVRSHIPNYTPTRRDLDGLASAAHTWEWPLDHTVAEATAGDLAWYLRIVTTGLHTVAAAAATAEDLAWCLRIVATGIPGCAEHARRHGSDDPCVVAAEIPPVAIDHPTLCDDCYRKLRHW